MKALFLPFALALGLGGGCALPLETTAEGIDSEPAAGVGSEAAGAGAGAESAGTRPGTGPDWGSASAGAADGVVAGSADALGGSVCAGVSAAASETEVGAVVVLVGSSVGEVEVSTVGSEGGGTGVVFDSVGAMAAGVSMLAVTCVESVIWTISGHPLSLPKQAAHAEGELELTMVRMRVESRP
jgi:hypothetical protein